MTRRSWGCHITQQRCRCVGFLDRLQVVGILFLDLLGLQALELFLLLLLGWGFVLCCLVDSIQTNTDTDTQHRRHKDNNNLALLWVPHPVRWVGPAVTLRVFDPGLDIHIGREGRISESSWRCIGCQTLVADREGVEHCVRVVPEADRGFGQESTVLARVQVQGRVGFARNDRSVSVHEEVGVEVDAGSAGNGLCGGLDGLAGVVVEGEGDVGRSILS